MEGWRQELGAAGSINRGSSRNLQMWAKKGQKAAKKCPGEQHMSVTYGPSLSNQGKKGALSSSIESSLTPGSFPTTPTHFTASTSWFLLAREWSCCSKLLAPGLAWKSSNVQPLLVRLCTNPFISLSAGTAALTRGTLSFFYV